MSSAHQKAKRFREVILHGTLIANTNYKDQLLDTNWELATFRVGTLNAMAMLAQHIHYYIQGVKAVLEGGPLTIKDTYSFEFPPIQSQQQWDDFLTTFWKDAEAFARLIEQLSDDGLKQVFVDEKYGNYEENIDVMIEHSYYHLGQIVLLKKLLLQDFSG